MDKKYLAKIIATDNEGLQMISACCAGAKVKISDIKFLQANKIFLLSIERTKLSRVRKIKKLIVFANLILLTKLNQKILTKKMKI
jgi:hypothetical protein